MPLACRNDVDVSNNPDPRHFMATLAKGSLSALRITGNGRVLACSMAWQEVHEGVLSLGLLHRRPHRSPGRCCSASGRRAQACLKPALTGASLSPEDTHASAEGSSCNTSISLSEAHLLMPPTHLPMTQVPPVAICDRSVLSAAALRQWVIECSSSGGEAYCRGSVAA